MRTVKEKRRIKQSVLAVAIVMIVICLTLCGVFTHGYVYADETETKQYSDVLTDLQKDPTFNIEKYPEKVKDYTSDMIQLAESEDRELFVYVYMPNRYYTTNTGKKIDTAPVQVSMSVADNAKEQHYKLYELEELSTYKTITKFMVTNVEVDTTKKVRYYSVSMQYRPWDKELGGTIGDDGNQAEDVGKLWTAETTDKGVKYTETHKQVIEIKNPVAGIVRYKKDRVPANWGKDGVDNHFIAFDTDLPIDDLLEADVSYLTFATSKDVGAPEDKVVNVSLGMTVFYLNFLTESGVDCGEVDLSKQSERQRIARMYAKHMGSYISGNITIKKDEKYTFGTGGWFSEDKYTWNRIMQAKDFEKTWQKGEGKVESGEYKLDDILSRQWVLCYRETPYDQVNNVFEDWFDSTGGYWYDFEITVLRLKFETNGKVYDMGTVSNKVDQKVTITGNKPKGFWESVGDFFEDNWEWLVAILIVIILFIIFMPFMPTILSVVWKVIKLLLKGLWWVLCLPFKGIAALVRKIRDRKGGAG